MADGRRAATTWDGDVRHVHEIAELLDVTVVTAPAYAAPRQPSYRSQPDPADGQEDTTMADTADSTDDHRRRPSRTAPQTGTTPAGCSVEDRVTVTDEPPRGLADEFRAAGFPGETATISWQAFEDRAVTWTGRVDN